MNFNWPAKHLRFRSAFHHCLLFSIVFLRSSSSSTSGQRQSLSAISSSAVDSGRVFRAVALHHLYVVARTTFKRQSLDRSIVSIENPPISRRFFDSIDTDRKKAMPVQSKQIRYSCKNTLFRQIVPISAVLCERLPIVCAFGCQPNLN